MFYKNKNQGFTLIETVVGIAIAAILILGVIGVASLLEKSVKAGREKIAVSTLAANYMEVVRNLPYSQIGTVNGNPSGALPDSSNAVSQTINGNTYKIYYEVTYVDDPADGTILAGTDPAPNDYKQVKMSIKNITTNQVNDFVTTVSPKGLEGLNNAGALYIKVFDANGQPISGANVHITNTAITPNIILDRTTDASGNWIEVGLPDSANDYNIIVTKSGYSTDQTYPSSVANPNPTKADATIADGQVTQISFSIDLLSNLNILTLNQTCQPVNGINLNISGAKLIGANPNVLKTNQNYASSAGAVDLTNIEWDTYTPTLLTGQNVMVYGSSPIQEISVLPSSSQTFTLILGPSSTNSLLAIVKDAATGQPLEGATVTLTLPGSPPTVYTGTTGGSVWSQIDWSGGSGQAQFTDSTKYFSDDGAIDVSTSPAGVRLKMVNGNYVSSGILESSTFDSGSSTTGYTTLSWSPTSQSAGTTLKFQIASNNDNATWNYTGPDGTASTYYTTPGSTISTNNNNNRYIRYKAFLSTTDSTLTPVLTSVNLNYVAGCFTPGQAFFGGLNASSNYTLSVSLTGYQTTNLSNLNINGNQNLQIQLSQ